MSAYSRAAAERTLTLDAAAHQYFVQLNPIALRIASDIDETRLSYGRLWCTLSVQQQSDIINETLIKPELALRYFGNYDAPATFKSLSGASSASALSGARATVAENSTQAAAALVLTKLNYTPLLLDDADDCNDQRTHGALVAPAQLDASPPLGGRYCAGLSLAAFTLQKVALKIIHDELLGTYRDEHSQPFSYRTRSQINLHLFDAVAAAPPEQAAAGELLAHALPRLELRSNHNAAAGSNAANCCRQQQQQLQCELQLALQQQLCTKSESSANKFSLFKQKFAKGQQGSGARSKCGKWHDYELFDNAAPHRDTAAPHDTYTEALYRSPNWRQEERVNLMQHCDSSLSSDGSGAEVGFTGAAATFDDDDDEKALCEDVQLLANDVGNLRKGFDFLNNW